MREGGKKTLKKKLDLCFGNVDEVDQKTTLSQFLENFMKATKYKNFEPIF